MSSDSDDERRANQTPSNLNVNSRAETDSGLSDDQKQALLHFQEIAGGLQYDEALVMMENHAWDLERTVHDYMGLGDPSGPNSDGEISSDTSVRRRNTASDTNFPTPQVDLLPPNQRVLRVRDTYPHSWLWTGALFLFEPIRLTYHVVISVVRFFVSFLWPDPRTQVTDPVGDVRRFISHFESEYTDTMSPDSTASSPTSATLQHEAHKSSTSLRHNVPPFFAGSYAQALQEAKRSLRFLIVYLHGDSHEDTSQFCRKTLQDPAVLDFLNNSQEVILWGCNINSPEGYRVSRTFREHTYPFIGVIGLSSPSGLDATYPGTPNRMALLGRIEGALPSDVLVTQLQTILNDHQGATIAARMERSEREANARLRREQDLAYAESLAQDRAKFAAKETEARNAALAAVEAARLAAQQKAIVRARKARQQYWHAYLPAPPDDAKDGSTVRLMIKMPNGSRVSRLFSLRDSAKLLYYFVLSQEDAPSEFVIEANFPKRLLPCRPAVESDLEDYMTDSEEGKIRKKPPVCSENDASNVEGDGLQCHITNWHPVDPTDPPSFADLGLIKPEMLFVLDSNA